MDERREMEVEDILSNLNLVNPDQEHEHEYEWSSDLLQRILGSLICDDYFLTQGLGLIKPSYFRDNAHRAICKIVLDYYEVYKGRPDKGQIQMQLYEQLKNKKMQLNFFLAELDAVCYAYEPGAQKREFFLDKITEFAKTQSLRIAYNKTLDLFKQKEVEGKWDKIREILQKALLVERNVDRGLDYFETLEERYERMLAANESNEKFSSGFASIDEALSGGLSRGELASFGGMSGSGKSLSLVTAAKANLMKGKNVLYISLEMDEDKVAERFDSMLTSINVQLLKDSSKSVIEFLTESKDLWGKLLIKQFPAGTADVTTIRAYYAHVIMNVFHPDLIIVDYVGEFRDIAGLKTYESRGRLVRDLRGFATEAKVCIFTAMQMNRSGRDAITEHGYMDDSEIADSKNQINILDAFWTISQTEPEAKANLGTIFVSKHRSGRGRFMLRFHRNPETLETLEISQDKYRIELSKVSSKAIEEVKIESMAMDIGQFMSNGQSVNEHNE